jgi:uncharacterized membrane protein
MSDDSQATPIRSETSLRTLAIIGYILFLAAMFNGLTAVAGVLIAYIKRDEARGTVWYGHFGNLITVFWVMLLGAFAGFLLYALLFPVSIGLILSGHFVWPAVSLLSLPIVLTLALWPILFVWFLYRIIRGLIHASDHSAY